MPARSDLGAAGRAFFIVPVEQHLCGVVRPASSAHPLPAGSGPPGGKKDPSLPEVIHGTPLKWCRLRVTVSMMLSSSEQPSIDMTFMDFPGYVPGDDGRRPSASSFKWEIGHLYLSLIWSVLAKR